MSGNRITGSGSAKNRVTRIRSGQSRSVGQGNAKPAEAPPDTPVGPLARAFVAHGISSQDANSVESEVMRLATSRIPAHTAVDTIRGITLLVCGRALRRVA